MSATATASGSGTRASATSKRDIRGGNVMSRELIRVLGSQLEEGLRFLHKEKQLAHLDLKPENVVVMPPPLHHHHDPKAGTTEKLEISEKELRVKISDLGSVEDMSKGVKYAKRKHGAPVTRPYRPPELLDIHSPSTSSSGSSSASGAACPYYYYTDMFSLGLLLHECWTGEMVIDLEVLTSEYVEQGPPASGDPAAKNATKKRRKDPSAADAPAAAQTGAAAAGATATPSADHTAYDDNSKAVDDAHRKMLAERLPSVQRDLESIAGGLSALLAPPAAATKRLTYGNGYGGGESGGRRSSSTSASSTIQWGARAVALIERRTKRDGELKVLEREEDKLAHALDGVRSRKEKILQEIHASESDSGPE
eukprot:CAMPEP_0178984834 /NCGR_PEP_ID=MMETSP0795-20121207/1830_1 /TAXON_ID=88552 /ORGANISM="Amoebophrya sp., Strain Ameob2" /LENGTH=366 /DNA_ID=CAMNT_0020675751 /DNA_START=448 /DNA_END=1548 /DNA_ORIENTATION=+